MAAEKHALLSASSADRWLHCPPSARLTEDMPDTTSDYAEEGRLAHAIAELRLSKAYTKPMGPKKFAAAMDKLRADPRYKPEMDRHVDTYLDHIDGVVLGFPERPYVAVEAQVDFSRYVPDGFGTADCIVIGAGTMHVTDFKYGQGVAVDAEHNPQMMLYALGALAQYGMFYPIETIVLTICQPRKDSLSSWSIDVAELLAWGESIVAVAELAHSGGGTFSPGEHCRFCKARARCSARNDTGVLTDFEWTHEIPLTANPYLLANDEIAQRIQLIRPYVVILKDLEEYALAECLAGRDVPGFKAVEGRSVRAWTDQEAAFRAAIAAGLDEALLYERKPISFTAVEGLLGKKPFAETLGEYVTKTPGKPALVEASDKRPAITGRSTIEDDFGGQQEAG